MIDKKGEKYWRSIGEVFEKYLVYMHVLVKVFMFMHICFVLQIGEKVEKVFDEYYA